MLNSIVTIAVLGSGMWVSATQIPGQWPLIIMLGSAFGFLMPLIGSRLPDGGRPKQSNRQAPNGLKGSGKTLYGFAAIIAALALWMIWLVLRGNDAARLPLGMASTGVFLPGACLGIAAYLITLAWKPVK